MTFLALASGAASAGDRPKNLGPDDAVQALKAAWDKGDDAGIVACYAEPDAAYVQTSLAVARRIDAAHARLGRVFRERLGLVVASELAPIGTRATSPLQLARFGEGGPFGTSLTVQGNRGRARIHLETRDGERDIPCAFLLVQGDWKLVLVSLDGEPLGTRELARMAATTEAQERTASALEALERDLATRKLAHLDLRKRFAQIAEAERSALARIAQEAEASRQGEKNRGKKPSSSPEKTGDDRDD